MDSYPDDHWARNAALSKLLLAMQTAVRVDDVQVNYLEAVGQLVFASAYGFTHFEQRTQRLTPASVLTRDAPTGLVADYHSMGATRDPLLVAGVASRSPVDNSHLMSEDRWHAESLYRVLNTHGLYHSLVVPLAEGTRVIGALYLARSTDDGPFAASDLAAMAIAKNHVEAALFRSLTHAALERHSSVLTWALDEMDSAVIVESLEGESHYTNRAFQRLVQAHPYVSASLTAMIEENLRLLRSGSRRLAVTSDSIELGDPNDDTSGCHRVRLVVRSVISRGVDDIVVSFPLVQGRDGPPPVEFVASLSAREREIVAWVAEGLTNRQIARQAFVTENTVRQHLKRVFAKLGVRNRAQLVQAVWQSTKDVT